MKRYYTYTTFFILIIASINITSCKRVKLGDADKRFAKGEYFEAAEMYRKVYRNTSPKKRELRGEVAFKLAESYRLLNNPMRANAAYANAVRYKATDSTLSLQYARSLHKVGKYKEAATQYEEFLKLYPGNRFAMNGLEGTRIAPLWKNKPTLYRIKRMELFETSKGGEFSPALLPPDYNQVYFTSNGKNATGDTISEVTGTRYNDIFMARLDENGAWMKPEKVDSPINTPFDEGAVSFSAEGTTMYYTYGKQDTINSIFPSIYVSQRSGGSWGAGSKIDIYRDTTRIYAHPAISPSGNYMYFVSDMRGGQGGKDIWRARMLGDMVDYIENLGPEINTAGDEMFPVVRNDSTLYFSSDGHAGMGGLDIFKAVYSERTKRWKIENLRSPINSEGDDFGITFEGEKEKGFFSSNRGDARGYDHIYSFEYPVFKSTLEGYIVDTDDEFIKGATIRMVGNDGSINKFTGRDNGTYSLDVQRGVDYVLLGSAPDHLNTKMALKTIDQEKDSTYIVDFVLTPINKPVVLENIFFDFDKADIRPEAKEDLDGLISLLELNPNVSIELSSHTDRKGSDEYNNRLSQRRADAVVEYLVRGGIKRGRLTSVGYGKQRPKVVTKSIVKKYDFLKEGDVLTEEYILQLEPEQQETADQVNRRTEFKVLSITYNLE